jgi:Fur family ferric uptake transcriptional regulator/Fur family peroxide stress response transcriptional regulator
LETILIIMSRQLLRIESAKTSRGTRAGARRAEPDDARVRGDLAGAGLRLTGPRRLILALLRATDSHPTAEWVHREVRKRMPRVSLGTVYRNLRQLSRQGLLAEIQAGPSVRFDARLDRHHHFTCSVCERIFDLGAPVDRRLEARIAAQTGFRVSHHRIEFYGACSACAPEAAPGRRRGSVAAGAAATP